MVYKWGPRKKRWHQVINLVNHAHPHGLNQLCFQPLNFFNLFNCNNGIITNDQFFRQKMMLAVLEIRCKLFSLFVLFILWQNNQTINL